MTCYELSAIIFILLPRDTWLFLLPLWDNDHPKLGGDPTGISRLEKKFDFMYCSNKHSNTTWISAVRHIPPSKKGKSFIPSQPATFWDHCLDCLTQTAIAT